MVKVYNGKFGVIDNPKAGSAFPHAITVATHLLDHRKPEGKDNPHILWRDACGISEIEYEIDALIDDLQGLKKKARAAFERERKKRMSQPKD